MSVTLAVTIRCDDDGPKVLNVEGATIPSGTIDGDSCVVILDWPTECRDDILAALSDPSCRTVTLEWDNAKMRFSAGRLRKLLGVDRNGVGLPELPTVGRR
jgi:hypothetical protein